MKRWLTDLDRILRGETTRASLTTAEELRIRLGGLVFLILLLAALYGVCMGFFTGFGEGGPFFKQWLAGIVKVPALFLLTVAVTFPSLYVLNALAGSRLTFRAVFQLLVVSLAVNVTVLASLGPIVAFFSVSTTSHPFILLLNVLAFVISGMLGYSFMLQTLYRWNATEDAPIPPPPEGSEKSQTGESHPIPSQADLLATRLAENPGVTGSGRSESLDRRIKTIFVYWMVLSGLVCAQMAWVLRPILGKPSEAFHWFSPRQSYFFQAILDAFGSMFS